MVHTAAAAGRALQGAASCAAPSLVLLLGLSGASPPVGFGVTTWANFLADATCRTGFGIDDDAYLSDVAIGPGNRQVVYQVNVGRVVPAGWSLTVSTCGSTPATGFATDVFVGTGCPVRNVSAHGVHSTAFDGLRCFVAAGRGSATCDSGAHADGGAANVYEHVIEPATSASVYFIVLSLPASLAYSNLGEGALFNWTFAAPSPSPSVTPTASATPSSSPIPFCFDDPTVGVAVQAWVNTTAGNLTGSTAVEARNFRIDPALWGYGEDTGGGTGYGDDGYYYGGLPSLCIGSYFPTTGAHMVAIDLRPAAAAADDAGGVFPWGGELTVSTCGSPMDTVLFVGFGCPTDSSLYQCDADSDDSFECPYAPLVGSATETATASATATATASTSQLENVSLSSSPLASAEGSATATQSPPRRASFQSLVRVTMRQEAPIALVMVAGAADGIVGTYSLQWNYSGPDGSASPSASSTASASVSPAESSSPSSSATASLSTGACVSHTPLWSPSGSFSANATATPTATANTTVSSSWSQTSQPTYSATNSSRGTPSRTATPTGTPYCPANAQLTGVLRGASGSITRNTDSNAWPLGDAKARVDDRPGR